MGQFDGPYGMRALGAVSQRVAALGGLVDVPCPPDSDRALQQVDILPHERECLPAPHSRVQHHRDRQVQIVTVELGHQLMRLGNGHDMGLEAIEGWQLDALAAIGRIERNEAVLDGLGERQVEDRMGLTGRGGADLIAAGVLGPKHLVDHRLDHLGTELLEGDLTELRLQVARRLALVAVDGASRPADGCVLAEPDVEPVLDGDVVPDDVVAGVREPFQAAQLPVGLRSRSLEVGAILQALRRSRGRSRARSRASSDSGLPCRSA